MTARSAAAQQYAIAVRRFALPARPAVVVVFLFEGNDLGDAEIFDQWRRSATPWNDYVLDLFRSRRGSIVVRPHLGLRTLDALVAIRSRLWERLVPPPEVAVPPNPFDRRAGNRRRARGARVGRRLAAGRVRCSIAA